MIYCVWYPSGGFGHFIGAMMHLHGENFQRPSHDLILGEDGNSHAMSPTTRIYRNQKAFDMPALDPDLNHVVLVDNGINDESTDFFTVFPTSHIIKICYDDRSWPIVAYTHIVKAMKSSLDEQLHVDGNLWPEKTDWAKREKIFLYLRDNPLRNKWRESFGSRCMPISCLFEFATMARTLASHGIHMEGGDQDWRKWFDANRRYISPVLTAQEVINDLYTTERSLDHIKDLWTQAVIYYYLYLEFGREVPHNDHPDFFSSTQDINQWLAH